MMARRAFTLIELLVVIAIIALLVSILLPALAAARRAARQSVCMVNMQQLGRAHHLYSSDFKQFIAAFNGYHNPFSTAAVTHFPNLIDLENQAGVTISDSYPINPFSAGGSGHDNVTVVCEQFSHLVLKEYLSAQTAVIAGSVCPEDSARQQWQRTPTNFSWSFSKSGYQKNMTWWPFSSSYQLLPTSWAKDGPRKTLVGYLAGGNRDIVLGQASDHDAYVTGKFEWAKRKLDEVNYPASKVAVADSIDRHSGKRGLYFAYPQAQPPLLFWDGSVSARKTKDANIGWNPRESNDFKATLTYSYAPDLSFEPPVPLAVTGEPDVSVHGYYKWTRGGLRGIDFAGKEISTKGW